MEKPGLPTWQRQLQKRKKLATEANILEDEEVNTDHIPMRHGIAMSDLCAH